VTELKWATTLTKSSLLIVVEMIPRRKLKKLFPRDAMQPLIDGSTKEQVNSTNENTNSIFLGYFFFFSLLHHIKLQFIYVKTLSFKNYANK
jgi:hypothetical protein